MTPEEQFKVNQQKEKEWYLAAVMGLTKICWNCRRPICEDYHMWVHNAGDQSDGRKACWNDPLDGIAVPMDEADYRDWHEDIMKFEDEDEN